MKFPFLKCKRQWFSVHRFTNLYIHHHHVCPNYSHIGEHKSHTQSPVPGNIYLCGFAFFRHSTIFVNFLSFFFLLLISNFIALWSELISHDLSAFNFQQVSLWSILENVQPLLRIMRILLVLNWVLPIPVDSTQTQYHLLVTQVVLSVKTPFSSKLTC